MIPAGTETANADRKMNADQGMARQERDLSWEPRRQMTLEAARKRSAVIKLLRLSFLVFAAAIILVIAVYIAINVLRKQPPPAVAPVAVDGEVRMINPRFSGRDSAGRPYVVIADTATRRPDEPETTDLVNPRLDTAPGADSSQVKAKRGVYQADRKILSLFEDVVFNTPNGYEYKTQHARFFIDSDTIVGDKPVDGTGPMGSVRADSYEVIKGGERVMFTGNVITHIKSRSDATSDEKGVSNE